MLRNDRVLIRCELVGMIRSEASRRPGCPERPHGDTVVTGSIIKNWHERWGCGGGGGGGGGGVINPTYFGPENLIQASDLSQWCLYHRGDRG